MAKEKNAEQETETFDAKEMLLDNAEKGEKIFYADRKKVVMIKSTTYLKEGKEINPHRVKAEALIKQGLAKEVK